jgi:hypothetical protein
MYISFANRFPFGYDCGVEKNQYNPNPDRVILEVKTSRKGEETVESMVQFLSSLIHLKTRFMLLWRFGVPISIEVAIVDQMIHFFVVVPPVYQSFVESQIIAQYPKALITRYRDYMPDMFTPESTVRMGQLKLHSSYLYPLKTAADFKEVDPMSSVLGMLSKAQPGDRAAIQFLLVPVNHSWQHAGEKMAVDKNVDSAGVSHPNPYAKVVQEKIAINGFKTAIRIVVNSQTAHRAQHYLTEVAHSFSSFDNPSGNSLLLRKPYLWQADRLKKAMLTRDKHFMPQQILNINEIAAMVHFPSLKLATIHNISWHKTILSDPPETLPVAEGLSEEEKPDVNFIARTEYRNKPTVFGIKTKDRRRHVYVIGKTGSGKSTFIANMAINDMRNGKGFCVIDPHGDLCEILLHYVPSFRVNDVIYLDPSDQEHAFSLNPLEVTQGYQRELVVSGIVAIFHKLYGTSWGPRLEYILRNALFSIIDVPNATLLMVPEILTNDAFRKRVLAQVNDPVIKSFWVNEFDNMHPRVKSEALGPILNKVGQFMSSTLIRNIIKNPKSTVDLQKVMDEGKIRGQNTPSKFVPGKTWRR